MDEPDDFFIIGNRNPPLRREVSVPSELQADAALQTVEELFQLRKARIRRPGPSQVEVDEGSQFALRMWGVLTKRGYRRLPLLASVTVVEGPSGHGSVVSITLTSNEGTYPMGRLPIVDRAYSQRFDAIIGNIERRLTAPANSQTSDDIKG